MKVICSAVLIAISLLSVVISGCGREEFRVSPDVLVFDAGATNAQQFTRLAIADMGPDDVIVSVNGCALRRATFDKLVLFRQKHLLEAKGANQLVVNKQIEMFERSYPKRFVAQRLLVDHAFASGAISTNEVIDHVSNSMVAIAKKRGKDPEKLLAGMGEERHFYLYELAISHIMDVVIKKQIPPKAEVTDEFLQTVKNQVRSMNAEAAATNLVLRAKLKSWRGQILSKGLDFQKLATTVSFVDDDNQMSDEGIWGEFEEDDLPSAELRSKVFALPEGGISDVLECDNGYHLVKVLSIQPAVLNAQGRQVLREKRTLSQIYIEKAPLLIEESDIVLTHDLKKQMQLQAVEDFVTGLSTNGTNLVVYPHGDKLF